MEKNNEKDSEKRCFYPIVLGVIFDPKTRKILIGKRKERDEYIPELSWAFPGGMLEHGDDLEETLKREIKKKTNLKVESLGAIFAKTYPEKKEFLSIYYLCEIVSGRLKAGEDFSEVKWVSPEEVEKHFTTSFHPHLREYILNLK